MIIDVVYSILKDATDIITPMTEEIDKLQADIDSGRFSNKANTENSEKIAKKRYEIRARLMKHCRMSKRPLLRIVTSCMRWTICAAKI